MHHARRRVFQETLYGGEEEEPRGEALASAADPVATSYARLTTEDQHTENALLRSACSYERARHPDCALLTTSMISRIALPVQAGQKAVEAFSASRMLG